MHSVYQPLNTDRREIRLATLLAGTWNDDIRATLSTKSIDQKPQYETLIRMRGPQHHKTYQIRRLLFRDHLKPWAVLHQLRSLVKDHTF
jgi:hypothetical protein